MASAGGCLVLSVIAASCNRSSSEASSSADAGASGPSDVVLEAAENQSSASTTSTAKAAEQAIVPIPAGKLLSGSTPGDAGRDPTLEPPLTPVELSAFDIDRFVYPNEPGKPPMRGVSREKASGLCKARGRRLCNELEWERACKGEPAQPFAGRSGWDPSCSQNPASCASGFGVVGMGAFREWTASDVAAPPGGKGGAAARGAASGASDLDRRCAHRSSLASEGSYDDITFRCCGGEPNTASIAAPEHKPTFEKADLGAEQLEQMFAAIPQLAKLKGTVQFFDAEAAKKDVTEKADAGADPKGYELTTLPVTWRPVPGEEIVVATGLVQEDAFIVALYRLPDGRYRVASSLVLKKDPGPIVVAFDRSVDNRLEWSESWQRPGESGRITYRDDRRVVITQE